MAVNEGGGSALGGLMGNNTLLQMFTFNLLGNFLSSATSSINAGLQKWSFEQNPNIPMSPADLATSVNRGFITQQEGEKEAVSSGVNQTDFDLMVKLSGQAPAPEELASAERRGLLKGGSNPAVDLTFEQGIAEGNLRTVWSPLIKALSVQDPTPNDALDALLEGQIDEGTAKDLYEKFGGNPQYFQMLYNTRGTAPSPIDAATMAMRGIIPWSGKGPSAVSYEQAFLEGPWRDKWQESIKALANFVPTLPEISSLYSNGAITEDQAITYMSYRGADKTIASAYLNQSKNNKVQAQKDFTLGTIQSLYTDKLISKSDAGTMIEGLGYTADETAYLIALLDVQREEQALRQALSRVHSLYTAHKINDTSAINALNALQIPAGEVQELLNTWTLERQANIKGLTASQIANALKYQLFDEGTAMQKLQDIGYQPYDAWVFLSVENKAPINYPKPTENVTLSFPT